MDIEYEQLNGIARLTEVQAVEAVFSDPSLNWKPLRPCKRDVLVVFDIPLSFVSGFWIKI